MKSRPGNEPAKVVKAAAPVVVAPKATSRINPHKLAKAEARVADLEGGSKRCARNWKIPRSTPTAGRGRDALGKQDAELRAALETAELELLALYEASAGLIAAADQSVRKYSTVVTTRTFLTCGLPWSRSLMSTTPWLALRMPPMRAPESFANCSADLRALAVASAISDGLIALSRVYSKSGARHRGRRHRPPPSITPADTSSPLRCSTASALATSVVRRMTVVE